MANFNSVIYDSLRTEVNMSSVDVEGNLFPSPPTSSFSSDVDNFMTSGVDGREKALDDKIFMTLSYIGRLQGVMKRDTMYTQKVDSSENNLLLYLILTSDSERFTMEEVLRIAEMSDAGYTNTNGVTTLERLLVSANNDNINSNSKYMSTDFISAIIAKSDLTTISTGGTKMYELAIDVSKADKIEIPSSNWKMIINSIDVNSVSPNRMKYLREVADLISLDISEYPMLQSQEYKNSINLQNKLDSYLSSVKETQESSLFIKPSISKYKELKNEREETNTNGSNILKNR